MQGFPISGSRGLLPEGVGDGVIQRGNCSRGAPRLRPNSPQVGIFLGTRKRAPHRHVLRIPPPPPINHPMDWDIGRRDGGYLLRVAVFQIGQKWNQPQQIYKTPRPLPRTTQSLFASRKTQTWKSPGESPNALNIRARHIAQSRGAPWRQAKSRTMLSLTRAHRYGYVP